MRILLPLLLIFYASIVNAQINIKLDDQLNCADDSYCISLGLESIAADQFIATSSIFVNYNASALAFESYQSSHFDGSDACDGSSNWYAHQYDATSIAGEFNLTIRPIADNINCPTISTTRIEIGMICFEVINGALNPGISIDLNNSGFNAPTPNNGTSPISINSADQLNSNGLIDCNLVLPVEWQKFIVTAKEDHNEISWETTSEINNSHFIIERKINSDSFKEIERVNTLVNNLSIKKYQIRDYDLQTGVTFYYRIKQVDIDGNFNYSKIIEIRLNETNPSSNFTIYPNPSNDRVLVEFDYDGKSNSKMDIWDTRGNVISENIIPCKEPILGKNSCELDISYLTPGLYILNLEVGQKSFQKKLIKLKD